MNRQGMRVLAVSQKSFIEKDCNFAIEDEKEMVLIGYLAFLDPPKPSAAEAIEQLYMYNVKYLKLRQITCQKFLPLKIISYI